jgi:hypothetical protein
MSLGDEVNDWRKPAARFAPTSDEKSTSTGVREFDTT